MACTVAPTQSSNTLLRSLAWPVLWRQHKVATHCTVVGAVVCCYFVLVPHFILTCCCLLRGFPFSIKPVCTYDTVAFCNRHITELPCQKRERRPWGRMPKRCANLVQRSSLPLSLCWNQPGTGQGFQSHSGLKTGHQPFRLLFPIFRCK